MIKIQKEDFNFENEIQIIKSKYQNVGAVSSFIGYVRNTNDNKRVLSIDLEVYENMAQKTLQKICKEAKKRWKLKDVLIIHRYGKLSINEKIVLIATFSIHREDSFQSCQFIMNFLKKDAPFWKKEFYKKNFSWL